MNFLSRCIALVAALSAAVVVLPAIASSETSPTIEAVNEGGSYGYGQTHHWSPMQVTVGTGGVVTMSNMTEVNHGVEWRSEPGSETPTCSSGVPVGTTETASGKNWSGTCKFTKPGTYTFWCTVHHAEMSGTITVKAPGTPTVTTEEPTAETPTGATLNGTINPEGQTTSYHFAYGTTAGLGQSTPELSAGSDFEPQRVSATLSDLSPDTEYHVELIATYGTSSTVSGNEETFRTPALQAPSVTTQQATAVTETGATLSGSVSPEGQRTTYFFKYGLSASYENVTPIEATGPEGVDHAALAAVTGLLPDTEYHFQLFAENGSDLSAPVGGGDQTFKTASTPPPPTTTTPATTPLTTPPPAATTPSPLAPALTPPAGSPFGSPTKLAASQHGASVHGTVEVSQAGAGGRLEVDLLADSASLARAKHSAKVRVGRLSRSSLKAGAVTFAVPLTVRGKSALRRHRRLALTVLIVLTPVHGAAVTVTKSVLLHG